MQQLYALIIKEFIAIWQDKKSRIVLVLPPLIQLIIFAHAATLDVQNIHLGIWNRDSGQKSSELINRIEGAPFFSEVEAVYSQKELSKKIDDQDILLALKIDDSFSRDIVAGKTATVEIVMDGRRSNAAQIAQGYLMQIIDRFNKDETVRKVRRQIQQVEAREETFRNPQSMLVQRYFYNENLLYTWFTVPGLVCILTTVVTITLTAMSIARERELGTLDQLLVSPLSPIQILIGKIVPAMAIGMFEGSFILLAAVTFFSIPFTGSLIAFYIAMFTYVLSIVGIGLFTSTLAKTQQQGMLGVFVFMMPGVTLSGFATPIENMPEWVQTLTLANPLRHFMFLVRSLFLKDLPFEVALLHTIPMILIGACTLFFAFWFFRRKIS